MVDLQFSVQYAIAAPVLSRQQLRAWAMRAVKAAQTHGKIEFERAELSLRIVDLAEAKELNRSYRKKDYAPNVLSFEYGVDPLGVVRGDIVICLPILEQEAQEQKKLLKDHAAHLLIHGVLHALGYDHFTQTLAEEMEMLEIAILQQMAIANPYV